MTATVLQTTLSVVLLAWAYLVARSVPYHRAWIWTGTVPVVVLGYLSLVARVVFEGSPGRVQAVVATIGAGLVGMAGAACLVAFAAVSAAAGRTSVPARGLPEDPAATGRDGEERVIIPDEADQAGGRSGVERVVEPHAGLRRGPRRALPPDDGDG
ncbi:MAG: hypothetical protein HY829_16050 [Actinobacteria bacterium]|nr:hypothetical protein [Actinomycetota bacterium]